MNRMLAYVRSLATRLIRPSQMSEEIDEELASHIAMRADDLQRTLGLGPAEAERRARLEFGGRQRFKEECRDEVAGSFVENLYRDVRFSVRVLRKSPGFTLVAIGTLALAIGANALVFGVMNAFLLRPLDVPRAESLYGIEHGNEHSMYLSYPDYVDIRDRNRSFEDLAGFTIAQVGMQSGESATRTWTMMVTGNYFDALGVQPFRGRVFHGSDEHGRGSAPYAVLSHAYWQSHFQDDPGVVGRTILLNKHPFTIVGIAPPEFHGTILFFHPDLYVPLVNQEQIDGKYTLDTRATQSVFMSLGHLRASVTPEQAVADLNSLGTYLEKTYPRDHGKTTFKLARPGLYGNYLGSPMRAFFAGLMVLSGLILLAACANLGSLFAARTADRSRDVALRLALGATRSRILRQLFTESLLISAAGGGLGLWVSVAMLRAFSVWRPFPQFPINLPATPDGSVYCLAALLAVLSALLFGLVPVRQVLRTDPYQVVKTGPGGTAPNRMPLRDLLLVVQIAICAVLVTSSIVAVRGLARSLGSSFGFEPRHALLADTNLSMAGYEAQQSPAIQKKMVERVSAIPGVRAAGYISRPPLTQSGFTALVFTDTTTDLRPANAVLNAIRYGVSPGYLEAAGTGLIAGRPITWHDEKDSPRVAVVNRYMAAKMFGSPENALGRQFQLRSGVRIQIVGVAQDGKYQSLTEDPEPAIFLPLAQLPLTETWLVVRSSVEPEQLTPAIRAALRDIDAALPVKIRTWNEELAFAHFPSRMAALVLGVMGAMGAVLALTGIFGMAAYSVSRRLKELGIRMALGAQWSEVLGAALGRAFRLLLFGSIGGIGLGLLATRVLASIVYQATPRDPIVLGAAVVVMLALGLLATWIPAQRALSLDPLRLLREE